MHSFKILKNKKLIWWMAALVWCSFIFANSQISSNGSGKISGSIVLIINNFIQFFLGENFFVTNFIVRKAAHFSEYLILGILLYKCFLRPNSRTRSFFYPIITGIIYAISDEIHQYFVSGRVMSAVDVIIDAGGIMLAVFIFHHRKDNRKRNKTPV